MGVSEYMRPAMAKELIRTEFEIAVDSQKWVQLPTENAIKK